jgi:ATP/maltotriose-dependent transcriptional regulator MalT
MQATWLTQTKFIPPRLREDFVPRRRWLDALHTAIDRCALTPYRAKTLTYRKQG